MQEGGHTLTKSGFKSIPGGVLVAELHQISWSTKKVNTPDASAGQVSPFSRRSSTALQPVGFSTPRRIVPDNSSRHREFFLSDNQIR